MTWSSGSSGCGGAGNTAPDAVNDSAATKYNTAVTINVLANDTDANGDRLSIYGCPTSSQGSVTVNSDGSLTFTPKAGFSGTATISYTITDGHGGYDTAYVSVSVAPMQALDGVVEGTAGNDLIDYNYTGDPEGDRIDHNDALNAGCGGSNDDSVTAGAGDDTVLAGLGNDTVRGEAGNDLVYGGSGNDSLDGGTGNDTLLGEAGCDTLIGGDGNDSLSGGTENDLLSGGAGDDTLAGGAGADTLQGGTGLDVADYSGSTAGVNVNLSTWTASGGDATGDVLSGVDGIIGTAYNDTLIGFDQQGTDPSDRYTNVLHGGAGNDYVDGRGGNDSLYGDAGNDTILGGSGADYVEGGTGDDRITGGEGADTLLGGDDRDVFLVGSSGAGANDFVDGGEGGNDFDTLDLTGAGPLRVVYDPANPENGVVNFLDNAGHIVSTLTFRNIERVTPCFTPGTLIATARGEVAVEDLVPGDRVITRDNGIQQIRWAGRCALSRTELAAAPHLRPVMIRAGSLGQGLPERDMMVSPNHRMLVASERAALYFDEHEVLVAAKHLVDHHGVKAIETQGVSYLHFMFDRHEVVLANGAWTESFQPGDQTLGAIGNAQRNEIFELFPELRTREGVESYTSARRSLRRHEAALLKS